MNHIPGIHDNGPCDHGVWRLTLTAYYKDVTSSTHIPFWPLVKPLSKFKIGYYLYACCTVISQLGIGERKRIKRWTYRPSRSLDVICQSNRNILKAFSYNLGPTPYCMKLSVIAMNSSFMTVLGYKKQSSLFQFWSAFYPVCIDQKRGTTSGGRAVSTPCPLSI